MLKVIEAVYKKGILKLLEKLNLPEGARVPMHIEGIYGLLCSWNIDTQKLKRA